MLARSSNASMNSFLARRWHYVVTLNKIVLLLFKLFFGHILTLRQGQSRWIMNLEHVVSHDIVGC